MYDYHAKNAEKIAKEDALYANEPWAKLAVEAGYRPYDTEPSARHAFIFCAAKIARLEATIADLQAR
jgi:hypothetical protein